MLKCLLAFFFGAVAVTSFVVASGVGTSGLGFVVATLCYGLLAEFEPLFKAAVGLLH